MAELFCSSMVINGGTFPVNQDHSFALTVIFLFSPTERTLWWIQDEVRWHGDWTGDHDFHTERSQVRSFAGKSTPWVDTPRQMKGMLERLHLALGVPPVEEKRELLGKIISGLLCSPFCNCGP